MAAWPRHHQPESGLYHGAALTRSLQDAGFRVQV